MYSLSFNHYSFCISSLLIQQARTRQFILKEKKFCILHLCNLFIKFQLNSRIETCSIRCHSWITLSPFTTDSFMLLAMKIIQHMNTPAAQITTKSSCIVPVCPQIHVENLGKNRFSRHRRKEHCWFRCQEYSSASFTPSCIFVNPYFQMIWISLNRLPTIKTHYIWTFPEDKLKIQPLYS